MKSLWGQGNRYLRIRPDSLDLSPKVARMVVVGMTMLILAIFVAGDVGLWNLWSTQKDLETLQGDISSLEEETAYLRREIESLKTDPFALEKVAREKYGYLRPGDRVYRIITLEPGEKKASSSPTSLDTDDGAP